MKQEVIDISAFLLDVMKWDTDIKTKLHYTEVNKPVGTAKPLCLTADPIMWEKWQYFSPVLDFNIWNILNENRVHSHKQSHICEQIMISSNVILFCGSAVLTETAWIIMK